MASELAQRPACGNVQHKDLAVPSPTREPATPRLILGALRLLHSKQLRHTC